MPYYRSTRRRRYGRRPRVKRATLRRRYSRYNRVGRPMSSKLMIPHKFKRTVTSTDINSSNVGPTSLTYVFSLVQLPSYTEFTNLYDKYMITRIVATFEPRNITSVTSPYALYTPYFHSCIDHNDDTAIASLTEIEQYQTYRRKSATRMVKRVLRPRVLTMVYLSAVGTAYSPATKSMWISTSDYSTPHYGIKVWIDQTASANAAFTWTPRFTYYFRCKDFK